MIRKNRVLLGIAGTALLVAGCSSGGTDTTTPTASATIEQPAADASTTANEAVGATGSTDDGANSGSAEGIEGTSVADTESTGTAASDNGTDAGSGATAVPVGDTTTSDDEALGPASGNGLCLDPNSPAVSDIYAGLTGDYGDWMLDSASQDPASDCPDLSYLLTYPAYATSSTPGHILFFHHGNYLGTATYQPTSYTRVVASSWDSVTAQYRWIVGDEALCCPEGGPSEVTFTWNGSGVTPQGEFPPAY